MTQRDSSQASLRLRPEGIPMIQPPHEILSDDVVVERNVMVAMRDGVRLGTDIYRPARKGRPLEAPTPVLLERTPYGKHQPSRSET